MGPDSLAEWPHPQGVFNLSVSPIGGLLRLGSLWDQCRSLTDYRQNITLNSQKFQKFVLNNKHFNWERFLACRYSPSGGWLSFRSSSSRIHEESLGLYLLEFPLFPPLHFTCLVWELPEDSRCRRTWNVANFSPLDRSSFLFLPSLGQSSKVLTFLA